jgi:hypothetical protein
MTRKPSKSHNSHDLSRCRRRSASARRCRLSVGSQSRFYCRNHAHLQPPAGEVVDLSAELMADVTKFTSASDINKFLSKILILLSQDRISPRRASILAYTCSLLLRTLPAIEREHQPKLAKQPNNVPVIWDIPSPDRARHDHPHPVLASSASAQLAAPAPNPVPAQVPAECQNVEPHNVAPQPEPTTQSAYNTFMRAKDALENPPLRNIRFRRSRVS